MKIRVKCVDFMASKRVCFLRSQEEFTVIGFTNLLGGPGFHIEGDPSGTGFLMSRFVPVEEIKEVIITIPDDLKYIDI